jgi:predicted acylesterase/phospholipase RssA
MFTHIFFSGGNIWGFTYLGVLRYLYTYPTHIQYVRDVGGTSIGSVFAAMFACKLTTEEIENIIYKYSYDDELKCNSSKNIINIIKNNGMESASKYIKYFIEIIETKFKITYNKLTFLELSKLTGINLHVNALCINNAKDTLFNVDNTPNVPIIDTLIASISIPINNTPHIIDGYYYCDAGFINNTVASMFKNIPPKQILSVFSNVNNDIQPIPKDTEIDTLTYHITLLKIIYNQLNHYANKCYIDDYSLVIDNHDNIVSIDINQEGIFHKVNKEAVDNCIIHGFKKTMEWFEKHQ